VPTNEQIFQSLSSVIDPDLKKDIVTLGMVQNIVVTDGEVSLRLVLTTPACPFRSALENEVKQAIKHLPGVETVRLQTDANVPALPALFQRSPIPGVRNVVAVASGKGGVGKSTVSASLAVALAETGAAVGLLDADIYGPSIPTMMGIRGEVEIDLENEIMPLERHGVKLMSFGFIAKQDAAVVWRGPLASKAIRQFLKQVKWGNLDYLIIDTPPGTGDVHLTLFQAVPLSGGIIVTTPQEVALADANRAIGMFKKLGVAILGTIENMSGEVFGEGGGERLSRAHGVPFLGRIPLHSSIRTAGDRGAPLPSAGVGSPTGAPTGDIFRNLARRLAQEISTQAVKT